MRISLNPLGSSLIASCSLSLMRNHVDKLTRRALHVNSNVEATTATNDHRAYGGMSCRIGTMPNARQPSIGKKAGPIYLAASRVTISFVARSAKSLLKPSSVSFHRNTLPSLAFL